MDTAELLILLIGSLAVTGFARAKGLPAPLLVTAVALAVSFLPGLPEIEIDSEVILTVVLPPLLYSAALDVSWQSFRQSIKQIRRLGIFLVIVTALAVALAAYIIIPDMDWPAAILLGAVVAPPDAVSAAAIGRKLGLPRRVMTVLSGESLINDAASLTLVRVFTLIAAGTSLTIWQDLGIFGLAIGVGLAVGIVLGVAVHWIRMRINDPVVETIMSILLPFVAYVLAEHLSGSGVIAVVTAGLYIGYNSPKEGYATRLQERPLWTSADVILEGFVFALIGLQLKTVVQDLVESDRSLTQTLTAAAVVLVVVILVRPLFVFESYARNRFNGRWLRPLRVRLSRGHPSLRWLRGSAEPKLNWRELTVISWTGMRGVVTLAAAVSVVGNSVDVKAQDTIFVIAFVVTVGTLLLQGLTLPFVIRALKVQDPAEGEADVRSEMRLNQRTTEAAIALLERRRPAWAEQYGAEASDSVVNRLKARLERQAETFRRDAEEEEVEDRNAPLRLRGAQIQDIRRELLDRRREIVLEEREKGNLDEEVMRRVLVTLDAEELAMDSAQASRSRS
ncbi:MULTISPECIES: sodium:proton antiporter [unclassified Curtobacterium]|uniref:cation:proton antiporter n=1 Tax=unclassified Curtobacterium TaxID=257496 RepID=UPI001AE3A39F|nr:MULTISPECIES: sodium:proton antiporter [unclassified Curtobacterium]MBP1303152.1 CPA1 family monovalent cation:H+ antiporter [Curtobacterium sp. 1310]MDB6427430.1 sodium:proton antiporter [Curtobacterium sp. 20TX0008]MDT0210599.1 sodium:proton antiporter [Curtobacterium sp. BRD11]